MTYDYELTLVSKSYEPDLLGNQVESKTNTSILCSEKSVTRSEFYSAGKKDLKPERVFVIHQFEYNGQTEVIFDNIKYKVIRTYKLDTEEIELTVEKA